MAKIYALVKDYNGISAGVSFRDGVGETSSPHLLKWFREHGYKIEETQKFTEDSGLSSDSEENKSLEENENPEESKKRSRKPKE